MTFIPSDNVLVFSTTAAAALTAEARASFAKYPPKTVKFICSKAKLFQAVVEKTKTSSEGTNVIKGEFYQC